MSLDSKGNPKLILYSYRYYCFFNKYHKFIDFRWVILALFVCSNIGLGMTMMTCGTLSPIVIKIYDVNTLMVNLNSLFFLFMFVPGNFFTIFTIQKYGFRICVIISSMMIYLDDNWWNFHASGSLDQAFNILCRILRSINWTVCGLNWIGISL